MGVMFERQKTFEFHWQEDESGRNRRAGGLRWVRDLLKMKRGIKFQGDGQR